MLTIKFWSWFSALEVTNAVAWVKGNMRVAETVIN